MKSEVYVQQWIEELSWCPTCSLTELTWQTERQEETLGQHLERPAACLDLYPSTRSTIATTTVATVAWRQNLNWGTTSPAAGTLLGPACLQPAGGKEKEGQKKIVGWNIYELTSISKESPTTFLTPLPSPAELVHLHQPYWNSSLSELWDHLSFTPSNQLYPS